MKRLSRFLLFVVVLWSAAVANPIAAQEALPSNETIAMNYLNLVYNEQNVEAVVPFFSETVVIHNPLADTIGVAGLVSQLQRLYGDVSALTFTPYAIISQDDMVVVPYVWQGTQVDLGPEAHVSGNGVEFFRFENGRIAEVWRHLEQHEFSILGSEEDYRTQLNMVAAIVPSVETMGIPMLTDAVHIPTAVEQTGIPSLADFPEFEWDTPLNPLVAQTGIPMLSDFPVVEPDRVVVSQVANTGIPTLAEMIPTAVLPSLVVSDEAIIQEWLNSYNQGAIHRALMTPDFTLHTCPCDDGIGTMDISGFVSAYENELSNGGFPVWIPLVLDHGSSMVSEGGLTAMVYRTPFGDADGVAIFRLEDGRLAEMWQF